MDSVARFGSDDRTLYEGLQSPKPSHVDEKLSSRTKSVGAPMYVSDP